MAKKDLFWVIVWRDFRAFFQRRWKLFRFSRDMSRRSSIEQRTHFPPHWNTWTLLRFHDRNTVRVRDLTFHSLSELQAAWSALSVDVTVSVAEQQGSFGRVSLPKEEEGVASVPVRCYLVPLLFQLSKIVFFPRTLNAGFTTEWTGEGIKGTSL